MAHSITADAGRQALSSTDIAPAGRRTFVRDQTLGSLLRDTSSLYFSNFRTIVLCYFLPTFPVVLMQAIGETYKIPWLEVPGMVLGALLGFVAFGAITVTISDICLGNTPSVRRSYAKLFKGRLWLHVFLTGLLQMVVISLGILLLVVPGVILAIRLQFSSIAVVLERVWGRTVLKRSLALTKGQFWRLTGIFALAMGLMMGAFLLVLLIAALLGGVIGIVGGMTGMSTVDLQSVTGMGGALLAGIATEGFIFPFYFTGLILLYYDLRVRNESFDVAMLAEDMMR